jgi:hypothetical protein
MSAIANWKLTTKITKRRRLMSGSNSSPFFCAVCGKFPSPFEAQELGAPDYEPANYLLDDRYYDNLSGQQAYKCFACRVRKNEG